MTKAETGGLAIRGAGRTAAVVLAAGCSSRMETSKALLPVGRVTAIERVISSLRAAGTGQVVVVTGHAPAALLPVLGRLEVERTHNPDYESGMFSSVRTGVAALRPDVDRFFVLPVDCPLVTAQVLRAVLGVAQASGKGIVYPTCFGRRGHPPLLSSRYIPLLLEAEAGSNLEAFLSAFAADETEVDVRDLTVLMDMDTPDEHRVLHRLAAILDGAAAAPGRLAAPGRPAAGARCLAADGGPGAPGPCAPDFGAGLPPRFEPSLTEEESLFLLAAAGTPANVIRHCRAVAGIGEKLAEALGPRAPGLDVALVRAACLLHDMARLQPNHALQAQEVLTNLGLPRLGAVVGRHMVIAPQLPGPLAAPGASAPGAAGLEALGTPAAPGAGQTATPHVGEAELVYLADKLVAGGRLVGLDEREARALRKSKRGPEAAERTRARMRDARAIAERVAAILGRPAGEIFAGLVVAPEGESRSLQVFLVRHAEPMGPGIRRFLGQADPELGPPGEDQARQLAERLAAVTGGACLDAVYSSDLRRCLRTAEIVGESCLVAVHADRRLREIDVGLWEGLTWEEAKRDHPQEYLEREPDVLGQPFPGGESFRDLKARVVPAFVLLVERSLAAGHQRALVVGHKGVNRVILAHVLGSALEDIFSIGQDYCALAVIQVSTGADGQRRFS